MILNVTRKTALCAALIATMVAACADGRPRPLPDRPPVAPRVAYESLIVSDPDGIRCNVTGKSGAAITVTTPRLVPMHRFKAPVAIRCFAEGYWTEQVSVLPGSKEPLLIRVLQGELITPSNAPVRGGQIGPGGEFPREVKITLRRDSFESPAARDAYYATELDRIIQDWSTLIARAQSECDTEAVSQAGGSALSRPKACRDGLRRLEGLRNAELQLVEQRRRRSRIP